MISRSKIFIRLALFGALMLLASACSQKTGSALSLSGSVAPSSNSPGTFDTGSYAATHSSMPRVLDEGGRVLTNPSARAITFSGDAWTATLNQFTSRFMVSSEWGAMTAEYGIGAASAAAPVQLNVAPPANVNDTDIQALLSAQFNNAGRPLGSPNDREVYVLYYPATSTITLDTYKSCVDFAGYHNEYVDTNSGLKITYAVIARCSGDTVDSATRVTSHEVVEAVTDPDNDIFGYYGLSSDFAIWQTLSEGSEVGDMCQIYGNSTYTPAAIGNSIQRSWSNASASSGNNPCVPLIANQVYFNAAPVLTDTVTYTDPVLGNAQSTTRGVSIPVGQSKTIELDLYSSAATSGPWTVSAIEDNSGSDLTFSFDKNTGINGDKIHLTIKVNSKNATYNGEAFWIKSRLNGVSYYWPVIVTN